MATGTSDYAKVVQFTPDGEGIDLTDMQQMQKLERMRQALILLAGSAANIIGDDSGDGSLATPDAFEESNGGNQDVDQFIFAPVPGSAFVYPTAVANQIQISPGPIMAWIDAPWSATGEEVATYRFGGSEVLTTGVGDATHPRYDLVEVKLEYIDADPQTRHFEDATTRQPSSQTPDKERRVQVTYQIKAGTPAATPTYPAPTAGFIAMAAILVPATHNAVHLSFNIRDLRMPIGIRAVDVDFKAFQYTGTNPWTDLNGAIASTAAASTPTDWVIAPCPIASPSARLIGVGLHCALGDDALVQLVQRSHPASNAAPTDTVIAELGNGGGGPLMLGGGFSYVDMAIIADKINDEALWPGIRDGRRGTPVWCNGTTEGMGKRKGIGGTPAVDTKLALRFSCDGSGVSGPGGRASYVRFWIAEGL